MKTLCTLILLMFVLSTTAQELSTLTNAADLEANFLGENVEAYKGQVLYLNKKPSYMQDEGYEGFLNNYKEYKYSRANIYQCCGASYSSYEAMAGKYFKVLDVVPHPKAQQWPLRYGTTYYLQLLDMERNQTLYYEYHAKKQNEFPFICMSFWNRAKRTQVGRSMVLKNTTLQGKVDMSTKKAIFCQPGEVWTCKDVIIDKDYKLSLLVVNTRNEKCAVDLLAMEDKSEGQRVFSPREAVVNKKKFGAENWNSILQMQVKGGMTSEMCKLSWGKPERVHEFATTDGKAEQWAYDHSYLYFRNDRLIRLQ